MENRTETTVTRIDTIFGTCYLQIDSLKGIVCGGNISTHRKEPNSQITLFTEQLADGLRKALEGKKDV